MKIDKQDTCTILADDKGDYASFATHLERVIPKNFEADHLIIDLSAENDLELEQLLALLKLSTYHRSSGHSFVIVNTAIDIDDIPDEMIVVPTLQEAKDILEMEAIERDLGF